eukprot:330920-Hanusia_phi.AAC.1
MLHPHLPIREGGEKGAGVRGAGRRRSRSRRRKEGGVEEEEEEEEPLHLERTLLLLSHCSPTAWR